MVECADDSPFDPSAFFRAVRAVEEKKNLEEQKVLENVQENPAVRHRDPGEERKRQRNAERTVGQTVDILRSSARISERIEEQTVDLPRSRIRIPGRIEEQFVDLPRSRACITEEVERIRNHRFAGSDYRPQGVCMRFLEGLRGGRGCAYGESCTFAHSWCELHHEAAD